MNEIEQKKSKGLTGFQLKYIAMILMVFDHIHYFFGYTGKIPEFFSYLGRLSAPLFLFCVVEGFIHTSNRRKYFLKIYAIAIGMGFIQFSFFSFAHFLVRKDGFIPMNQMMASYVILLVVLQGIDWCSKKQWGKGIPAIILPIIFPYLMLALLQVWNSGAVFLNFMFFTVTPLHTAIADGGTITLIMGVAMYLTHKNRKLQAIVYAILVVLWDIVRIRYLAGPCNPILFFTDYYEWYEIFSVIFMLLYNGQRGHGSKKLFYWFYPVHIYLLYALSCILI